MDVHIFFFFFIYFISFPSNSHQRAFVRDLRKEDCLPYRCGEIQISFPFRIETQHPSCGLQGFNLTCKQNQAFLHLPYSGEFNVSKIDYSMRALLLADPHGCLHRRFLELNLSSSPFDMPIYDTQSSTYIQCFEPEHGNESHDSYGIAYVPCLSNNTSWFYVMSSNRSMGAISSPNSTCEKHRTVNVSAGSYRFYPIIQAYVYEPLSGRENNMTLTWEWELPKKDSKTKLIAKAIIIAGSVFTAVTLALAYYIYRKPTKPGKKEDQLKIEKLLKEYRSLKLMRYSYASIKKMTKKFKHKLGKGGYGTVYKGKLSNETQVAVKILENPKGDGQDFINEITTIGRIHHVNVVRLLGFCSKGTKRALVYEFMPNQSLEKFIFSREAETHQCLDWKKLLDIAIGIARGIEYLHHGCSHRILHLDIKPHNILLDHDFNPKISDFGLAKICLNNQSNVSRMSTRGTIGYIAPEVLSRTFGIVSYKSDVYSFGMVMLEMVGGRKTSDAESLPQWIYNQEGRGTEIEGEEIAKKLTIVALWCIQLNPNDRPSMKRVITMLEGGIESLQMPQNPFV